MQKYTEGLKVKKIIVKNEETSLFLKFYALAVVIDIFIFNYCLIEYSVYPFIFVLITSLIFTSGYFIYFLYRFLTHGLIRITKQNVLYFFISLVVFSGIASVNIYMQGTTIGSRFEKEQYKEIYYAEIKDEYSHQKDGSPYTLPVEIHRTKEMLIIDGEIQESVYVYHILHIYHKEGTIHFNDAECNFGDTLKLNKWVKFKDSESNNWYIKLTPNKAIRSSKFQKCKLCKE